MRMVLGICILVDGYPIIFFFRETLHLAPGSSAFTAAAFGFGLFLMVPFTVLRKLYRPNFTMLWMGLGFLVLSIAYMFLYNGDPGADKGRDMIYFSFVFIFMFLLINIPNDIIPVFVPVVIFFTFFSNLGLVYSLLTDPNWTIGLRATISLDLANAEAGSGNPHVFARNAFMSIVASVIWLFRPNVNVIFRLFCFFNTIFSIAILVLTQTRSSVLALILATILFLYFNVRPAQVRMVVRNLFTPIPIIVMCLGVFGVIYFFRKFDAVFTVLNSYFSAFIERNLDNIYALFGLKAQGADYKAVLDDSSANRVISGTFVRNALLGHVHMLILGYGYKYSYLDVPMLEAFITEGLLGLVLFGGITLMSFYYSLRIMYYSTNPLSTFMAYFFVLIFVLVFTGGRPYEITYWFPFAMMIRFVGIEHLFPAYLLDGQYNPYATPAVSPEKA